MPLPANLAAMSQNPALNGPDGSTDGPPILDDGLRLAYSGLAQLRDGVGFTAGALTTGLGYTPVRQYLAGTISIGWSSGTSKLNAKVDATDFGGTWPIDISGSASTVGGKSSADMVVREDAYVYSVVYDLANGRTLFKVSGTPQPVYTTWGNVAGRPSDLGSFTNGPGYVTSNDAILRIGSVTGIGNTGSSALTANIAGYGAVAWGVTPSDERLKLDIADSTVDSLSKVTRIRFVGFRFIEGIDDGGRHEVGVIAQEIEQIDPRWVLNAGTWKQPDVQQLLIAALQSIQQLNAEVQNLRSRITELEGR